MRWRRILLEPRGDRGVVRRSGYGKPAPEVPSWGRGRMRSRQPPCQHPLSPLARLTRPAFLTVAFGARSSARRVAAVELETQTRCRLCSNGLTVAPTNKVHHVVAIARVAAILGEDEDRHWIVANEMDRKDGLIWVCGSGDDASWRSLTSASRCFVNSSRSTKPILSYSSAPRRRDRMTASHAEWLPANRRLFEPIGNIPHAKAEARYYAPQEVTPLVA